MPAALAVVLLLATTGFRFSVGGSAYQPFVSPLPVLSEVNASTLFLIGHLIALALYFLALLHIVFRLGMREWPALLMASILLGLTYLDSGYSFLAGANIVGGHFTDTEAATAFVVVSLALAWNRRIIWALIALLLAAPAIAQLAHVGSSQWLMSATSLQQWVMFVSMLALGLSAFSVLGPRANLLCIAFLGCFAVFIIGCVLPFVTDSQWLLTLRPMAADGLMQVLATVGAVTVVVQDMRYGGAGRVGLSLVIAASLLVSDYALPIGALAMLARAALAHGEMLGIERRVKPFNQHIVHNIAAPALILLAVAGGGLRVAQLPHRIAPAPQERLQLACQSGADYYTDRTDDGFDPRTPSLRPYLVFDQDGYFVIDTRRYCAHSR